MPLDLDDPTAIALAIFRALSDRGIEAALYGGLALAAYGEPRETRDADFAVAALTGAAAAEALTAIGVRPVLALDRARFGGLLISRITLAEGGGRAGLNMVDLVEPRSTDGESRYPGPPDRPVPLQDGGGACASHRSESGSRRARDRAILRGRCRGRLAQINRS